VFSLLTAKQSDSASSFLDDRSPQPSTLQSAVAAVFATVNEIVKVYAVHFTGTSSAEVVVNIMTSMPLKLLMGNKYIKVSYETHLHNCFALLKVFIQLTPQECFYVIQSGHQDHPFSRKLICLKKCYIKFFKNHIYLESVVCVSGVLNVY